MCALKKIERSLYVCSCNKSKSRFHCSFLLSNKIKFRKLYKIWSIFLSMRHTINISGLFVYHLEQSFRNFLTILQTNLKYYQSVHCQFTGTPVYNTPTIIRCFKTFVEHVQRETKRNVVWSKRGDPYLCQQSLCLFYYKKLTNTCHLS